MMRPTFLIPLAVSASVAACSLPFGAPGQPGAAGAPAFSVGLGPTTVSGAPATSGAIRANPLDRPLKIGEEKEMAALLRTPDNQIWTRPLVWLSGNVRVASVSPLTGQLKAVGPGTAIVSAVDQDDPQVKAVFEVTVVEQLSVLLVKIDPSTVGMVVGDKIKLAGQVQLADGQINGNVTWGSSDDTIATVNPTTGDLSAVRTGRVTVVASYTADPRFKGLADIVVVADRKDLPALATPAPTVFKPGATPIPVPNATVGTGKVPSIFDPGYVPSEFDPGYVRPSGQPSASPLVAPSAAPATTGSTGTIKGVVTSSEGGAGVPGATVTLGSGQTAKTDGSGAYSLSAPLGTTTLTATKSHFDAANNQVSVSISSPGSTITATPITLKPQHWFPQISGVSKNLRGVFATDESHAWVAGDATLLYTTDGGDNWLPADSAPIHYYQGVRFVNATTGWAYGSDGAILKSGDGGKTWTAQPTGVTNTVYDLCFIDANTAWAVYDYGVLSTIDGGAKWVDSKGASGRAIAFFDSKHGVVGREGYNYLSITNSGGLNWQLAGEIYSNLGITMFSQTDVWAFGDDIYKSSDGGLTFEKTPGIGGKQVLRDKATRATASFSGTSAYFATPQAGWSVGESSIKKY